jgi:hypothetical protein
VVLVVWTVARVVAGIRPLAAARQLAAVAGLVAAAGGVWLVRNLLESGNPVFPQEIAPLGITIFAGPDRDTLRDAGGQTIAQYFDQPDVWVDYLFHEYRVAAAGPALLVAALALAALIVFVRRRAQSPPAGGTVLALLVCALGVTAAYVVTPFSALGVEDQPTVARANFRYAVPALMAAVGPAVWALGALRGRWLVAVEALALAAMFDGLRLAAEYGVTNLRTVVLSFAVAAGVVGLALAFARRLDARRWRQPGPRARRVALTALALVVAYVLVAGDKGQRTFNAGRYVGHDPVLDTLQVTAGEGRHVGLAGVWTDRGIAPIYPAFGPRLGNEVEYHGSFVHEILRRYEQRGRFVRELRRSGYDLLIIGRGPTIEEVLAGEKQLVQPKVKEEDWAKRAGYREVARSDRFILMRRR